jgi:hypothetical protein
MPSTTVDLQEFGVHVEWPAFTEQVIQAYWSTYGEAWSVEDFLARPSEGRLFCDLFRRMHGYRALPDNVILRVLNVRATDALA